MSAAEMTVTSSEEHRMCRILWSSILGTAVEWYDFLIYAVATALVFNKRFFPSTGPALSGGLTPFIAAALMEWSGGAPWPIAAYLVACALLTATAALLAPETARRPLDGVA